MITKGVKQLVEEANAEIETVPIADAQALREDDGVVFVDIRDVRELWRDGTIPDALHAPRGMLEFWVDPESPYYKEIFGVDLRFVFHCASGWRSALTVATLNDMGFPAAHLKEGFTAWVEAGGPVEAPEAQGT